MTEQSKPPNIERTRKKGLVRWGGPSDNRHLNLNLPKQEMEKGITNKASPKPSFLCTLSLPEQPPQKKIQNWDWKVKEKRTIKTRTARQYKVSVWTGAKQARIRMGMRVRKTAPTPNPIKQAVQLKNHCKTRHCTSNNCTWNSPFLGGCKRAGEREQAKNVKNTTFKTESARSVNFQFSRALQEVQHNNLTFSFWSSFSPLCLALNH